MERIIMSAIKFKILPFLCVASLFASGPAVAVDPTVPVQIEQTDIDLRVPHVQISPAVTEPTLNLFEGLPGCMFINSSSETAYMWETNPYQAPRSTPSFLDETNAFRLQTDESVGYALSPKTRTSFNYSLLSNTYQNFTPSRLNNTANTFGVTMEHDFYQSEHWLLRGSVQVRQVLIEDSRSSGDILPSATLLRMLSPHSWAFANTSLDLNRNHFVIGDLDVLTPIATVGIGGQVPYEQKTIMGRLFQGMSMSLSSTYSFATNFEASVGSPRNYQSLILTGELSKPLWQHCPLSTFVRAEPIFNFGQNRHAIGLSGIDLRLIAGLRLALAKPAVYTLDLAPKSTIDTGGKKP